MIAGNSLNNLIILSVYKYLMKLIQFVSFILTDGTITVSTDTNNMRAGDSFTLTCAVSIKAPITLVRPSGVKCGNCLVDNPVGLLGLCQTDTTAAYTVDCEWGSDTGTMIFRVDNTTDMEFGMWACGESGTSRIEYTTLDIWRYG